MQVQILVCSDHKDERLRDRLDQHLKPLRMHTNKITFWYNSEILAGLHLVDEFNRHLDTAQIILILVSPDFISSDYYDVAVIRRVLEKHKAGKLRLIPIILRAINWEYTEIGKLHALPIGEKPVAQWRDRDQALKSIAVVVKEEIELFHGFNLNSREITNITDIRRWLVEGNAQYMEGEYEQALSSYEQALRINPYSPLIYHYIGTVFQQLGHHKQAISAYKKALELASSVDRLLSRRQLIGVIVTAVGLGAGTLYYFLNSQQSPSSVFSPMPLKIFRQHTASVNAVVWSPSGKQIVSGSKDKTVRVWDATDSVNSYIYRGHTASVNAVAWSPDGKRIASGSSDYTVQVWDASNGGNVFTYKGHLKEVNAVAWSPDGKRIASGSSDYTVQVWDASSGGNVFTYKGHLKEVITVAWSPNGRIASGSSDQTVQVWDANDGRSLFIYRGHSDQVLSVAWSPDGQYIASGSADQTAQVWDSDGYTRAIYQHHQGLVDSVAWSPNGSKVSSGSADKTVQVWNWH